MVDNNKNEPLVFFRIFPPSSSFIGPSSVRWSRLYILQSSVQQYHSIRTPTTFVSAQARGVNILLAKNRRDNTNMADQKEREDDEDHSVEEELSGSEEELPDHASKPNDAEAGVEDGDSDHDDMAAEPATEAKRPQKVHKLSLEKTRDFNETLRRRGVIYVARVPPRMTPTKLRALLGQFGEVTRVYLVEEDKAARKRRRQRTGNAAKRYIEGWVEFASKKVAKHVAQSLNTTPISNHKRNVHYGDLWNLKYLSKFKWSHLTEKVAYERRVREQKIRLETLQARKETAAYKQQVETGQKLDKIAERRRKRATEESKDDAAAVQPLKKSRKTKQLRVLHDGADKSASQAVIGSLL